MNNSFIEKMRNASNEVPKTFSESLFSHVGWKYSGEACEIVKSNSVEKANIVNALKEFADEKLGNEVDATLKFDGGEIAKKVESISKEYLLEKASKQLSSINLSRRLVEYKLNEPNSVRVMFVNDLLLSEQVEFSDTEDAFNELQSSFRIEAANLFYKMIKAMKLKDSEFVISAIGVDSSQEQASYLEELNLEIAFFRPELVITLGAVATQSLLQNKERLAKIHGQFFTSKTTNNQQFSYQLMPLFHPELLLINPNMKKTAWIDMQKAMQELDLV